MGTATKDRNRVALVVEEGCGYCEQAVQKYKTHITSGLLDIVALDDLLDNYEGAASCLCTDAGCAVPQVVVLEGRKVKACAPALGDEGGDLVAGKVQAQV